MRISDIVVGQNHPSPWVRECLLNSAETYDQVIRRIYMWNLRHKSDQIMLTII